MATAREPRRLRQASPASLTGSIGTDGDSLLASAGATPPARKPRAPIVRSDQDVIDVTKTDGRPIISLDDRKLSKAAQARLAGWRGKQLNRERDAYLAAQMEDARQKYGHAAVITGTETSSLICGIPCPLVFEYLIGQDMFPVGIIMHLNGPPESNKSSFLYEMYGWFIDAGGFGNHFEVESKMSPDFMTSILGDMARAVTIDFCDAVESWQQHLLNALKFHQSRIEGTKKDPGPGRQVPILFGVDSIMGKLSYETQERVSASGHGGRAHPVEALAITQWIKVVPSLIVEWPYSIVLNNHLKMGTDDQGRETRRTGGGVGVGFQESLEISTHVRRRRITSSQWDGRVIGLRCWKNSLGTTGREADVRLLWWEVRDPETNVWRQVSAWDWDWALVKLLTTITGREGVRLNDVLHIKAPKTSDVDNTAWSSTLGMKERDAVSWRELGGRICGDAKLVQAIREALGIKRRPLLQANYTQQRESLLKLLR